MSDSESVPLDIVMRVRPRPGQGAEYDVWIYAPVPLPVLATPVSRSKGIPDSYQDLPLQGVQTLSQLPNFVAWDYIGYLGRATNDQVDYLSRRLIVTFSPALRQFFAHPPALDRPYRIWWDCDTLPVATLPWELAAYADSERPLPFVFLRGSPPRHPYPRLPLPETVRLAVIGQPAESHWEIQLWRTIKRLNQIEVVTFPDSPLQAALQDAIAQGFSLIHLFINGRTEGSPNGLLYAAGDRQQILTPNTLSHLFSGSTVAAVALSTPDDALRTAPMYDNSTEKLNSYWAFAYLGQTTLALPTIVAPMGPIGGSRLIDFWSAYYTSLTEEEWDVAAAMTAGQQAVPALTAMALFLRHGDSRLFVTGPARAKMLAQGAWQRYLRLQFLYELDELARRQPDTQSYLAALRRVLIPPADLPSSGTTGSLADAAEEQR